MLQLKRLLLIALGAVMLTACSETSSEAEMPVAEPPTVGDETTQAEESDVSQSLPTPLTLEQAVEAARADMTEQMTVSTDDIEVVTALEVTWGDGSMGCPEPGMMYTQALVPGFFIHLRHGSKDAFYHAGQDGQPGFCPADRSTPPIDSEVMGYGPGGGAGKD
ncbi:MAG: hypothetical protein AAGJ52_11075 [Pseudomonadota bacterium]